MRRGKKRSARSRSTRARRAFRWDTLPLSECPGSLPFTLGVSDGVGNHTGTCLHPAKALVVFPSLLGSFGSTDPALPLFTPEQNEKLAKLSKGVRLGGMSFDMWFGTVVLDTQAFDLAGPPDFLLTFASIRYAVMIGPMSNIGGLEIPNWAAETNFVDEPNLFSELERKNQHIIHRGEVMIPQRWVNFSELANPEVGATEIDIERRRHVRFSTNRRLSEDDGLYILFEYVSDTLIDQLNTSTQLSVGFSLYGHAKFKNWS